MFLNVNNVRYHIQVDGKGKPLVLLHGFTGSLQTWEPFLEMWRDSYELIRIDIIGHGLTDHPEDSRIYSMENAAADLAAILDYLELKEVAMLGYSMGGRLALTFANIFPARVSHLILESSSPGLKTVGERKDRQQADLKLADFIATEGLIAFINKWEKLPLFQTQQVLPVHVKEKIRNERIANSKIGLMNSLKGMGTGSQPSWWDKLSKLRMPILLLVGELDIKFCIIANQMKEQFPHATINVVENTGHAIHVENPDFFGKIVKDWLK